MKKLLVMLLCATSISAMFKEEEQTAENKMQLIYSKQGIQADHLLEIMKGHPRLHELAVTDDLLLTHMRSLPDGICLQKLTSIDFRGCRLTGADTLPTLLRFAPVLQKCVLARNELQELYSSTGVNAQLPYHLSLTELDCSYNNITVVDFVLLKKTLPSLKRLNLAHNRALTQFKTEGDFSTKNGIPEIDLRGTNLSEAAEKEIIRNSQGCRLGEIISIPVGAAIGCAATVPFMLNVKDIAALSLGTPLGTVVFVAACPIVLAATKPENRIVTLYVPLLDRADYADAETRSAYFRFVKNFPYIGNITRCCRAQDPDYEPLSTVEEKE